VVASQALTVLRTTRIEGFLASDLLYADMIWYITEQESGRVRFRAFVLFFCVALSDTQSVRFSLPLFVLVFMFDLACSVSRLANGR